MTEPSLPEDLLALPPGTPCPVDWEDRLAADPALRARLHEAMRTEGLLRAHHDTRAEQRWAAITAATAAPIAGPRGWPGRAAAVLLCAAALVLALWLLRPGEAVFGIGADGRPLLATEQVVEADTTLTLDDGSVRVDTTRRSALGRVAAAAHGSASALRLHAGAVAVQVRPGPPERFALVTPHGDLVVKGTAFTVVSSTLRTDLAVSEGTVAWRRAPGGRELAIGAGGRLRMEGDLDAPTGLLGTYRRGGPEGPAVLVRIDAGIDRFWGLDSPLPEAARDPFTVEWTGHLVPPRDGRYRFHLLYDDTVNCWLDGRRIASLRKLSDTGPVPAESLLAPLSLRGGVALPFRLVFADFGNHANVRLSWQIGDGPLEPVPGGAFRPGLAARP